MAYLDAEKLDLGYIPVWWWDLALDGQLWVIDLEVWPLHVHNFRNLCYRLAAERSLRCKTLHIARPGMHGFQLQAYPSAGSPSPQRQAGELGAWWQDHMNDYRMFWHAEQRRALAIEAAERKAKALAAHVAGERAAFEAAALSSPVPEPQELTFSSLEEELAWIGCDCGTKDPNSHPPTCAAAG